MKRSTIVKVFRISTSVVVGLWTYLWLTPELTDKTNKGS